MNILGLLNVNTSQSIESKPIKSEGEPASFLELFSRIQTSPDANVDKNKQNGTVNGKSFLSPTINDEMKMLLDSISTSYGGYIQEEIVFDDNVSTIMMNFPEKVSERVHQILNNEIEEKSVGSVDELANSIVSLLFLLQIEKNGDQFELTTDFTKEIQQFIAASLNIDLKSSYEKITSFVKDIAEQTAPKEVLVGNIYSKLNTISNYKALHLVHGEESYESNNMFRMINQAFEGKFQDNLSSIEDFKKLVATISIHLNQSPLPKEEVYPYFNQKFKQLMTTNNMIIDEKMNNSLVKSELVSYINRHFPLLQQGILQGEELPKLDNNNIEQNVRQINKNIESILTKQIPSNQQGSLHSNASTTAEGLLTILNKASQSLSMEATDVIPQQIIGSENTQMSRIQQFVLHVGQTNGNSQAKNEFVQQFYEIVNGGRFRALANGHSQMVIQFKPEHLGSIVVKLTHQNGELTAKIIAASNSARDMIEANIHQLKTMFQSQNLSIDKLETYTQQQYNDLLKESNGEEQKQNQHQRNTKNQDTELDDEKESFKEQLLEEINLQA